MIGKPWVRAGRSWSIGSQTRSIGKLWDGNGESNGSQLAVKVRGDAALQGERN